MSTVPPPADPPAPEPLGMTGYLAAEGFVGELVHELGEVAAVHDRLVFAPGPARPAAWAQNVWYDPVRLRIDSIKQGARALRALQRNWALYPTGLHRRAQLIQDLLPHVSAKPLPFPSRPPVAPLGSWTLLDEGTIVAAPRCAAPFRHGEVQFVENRTAPPNRAYLKLWEALVRLGEWPQPGQRCLDLGACPGGWTWVLQELGADVVSVDKAPLAPEIAALPRVEFRRQSAFALTPAEVGPVDWLCCDVVCYPQRLLGMVGRWLESGLVGRFVCSVKFQGPTDHEVAREFAAIPGATLTHLFHNKHELTWMHPGPPTPP